MKKIVLVFVTAFALMFAPPLAASAATGGSNDYSTLAAQWWTWALTQPKSSNPLLDTTGALCANQQSGKMWFLGGAFNSTAPVTRSCTIPAGTSLYFPLVNAVDVEYAHDNVPAKTVRSYTAFVQDSASNLYATLDGQNLSSNAIQFEHSDLFSFNMPTDNVFGAPAGYMSPCADSGYYALLKGLSAGSHILKFGGTLAQPDGTVFTETVTYSLTVSG
ncbi:hypothetical protein RBS60_15395 [Sinomonas sp. ASV486]|uniref:hypothetical protein n=1 Tax=Sinomonas sp. ASV486 TaxID=3051170 RepID=UPI0027DDD56A|nr:hypothetical protein [Sinomonas sp. ASV486]MDQ4491586.1 hypothetical protein [Sinomonas sp. ASV486]